MTSFVGRLRRPNRTREGRISRSFDAVRVFLSARATAWFGFAIASAKRSRGPGCRCRGHGNEPAALWLEQSVYSRPTARFWVIQSNGRYRTRGRPAVELAIHGAQIHPAADAKRMEFLTANRHSIERWKRIPSWLERSICA